MRAEALLVKNDELAEFKRTKIRPRRGNKTIIEVGVTFRRFEV
jgi:hypothetical protein